MAQDSPPSSTAEAGSGGGAIESRPATPAESALELKLRSERRKLVVVQEIGRALSSELPLDQLLALIMEKVTILMDADRATLYLVSDDRRELWSKILQGGETLEIRLKVGEGIAGWVASSGEVVNIPDAYTDTRFQPAVDLRSGYRTRSILCVPMRNNQGSITGVLQVLNKRGGPFTSEDEELLTALSGQAAVAVENAKLYHSVVAKNRELELAKEALQQRTEELNLLYELEREINAAGDLAELLQRVLVRAMATLGASSGCIGLIEPSQEALRVRAAEGPLAPAVRHRLIALGTGPLGWAAAHRRGLLVAEPRDDARCIMPEVPDFQPRNLVAAPLVASDQLMGAIALADHQEDGAAAPFADADLRLLHIVASQVARAIQGAHAKAERQTQDRLASIGQMLAGVLHDLKTPMTIISGYAQLMAQIDDAAQRELYVEQILRQFDVMSGMTREVLAFARGETNVLVRKVYMHRFLEQVANQLRHAIAGRGVELRMEADYTGVAYFDEQKMLRVCHNLARNAAEAMPDGGEFVIRSRAERGLLVLEFSDTGPGIPPELEGRLFDLFASSRPDGTGLGLAIVHKIVEEHRGRIEYVSRPGCGTTFRVLLSLQRPVGLSDRTGEFVPLG
jgi:signal transduction histidine kinase